MVFGDPALIVALTSRDTGGLGTGEVGIGDGLDFLGLTGGGAASLGEEGLDPGLVDEVESSSECTSEEEVEEDNLRIKDADGRVNDTSSVVADVDLEDASLGVGDHCEKPQLDILGMHVQRKRVRKANLLAGCDLGSIRHGGEVLQDGSHGRRVGRKLLESGEDTGDELDGDVALLVVGYVDESFGGLAIDELHAKDVGVGEGSFEIGLEDGGSGGGGLEVEIGFIDRGNLSFFLSQCAKNGHGQESKERGRLELHDGVTRTVERSKQESEDLRRRRGKVVKLSKG